MQPIPLSHQNLRAHQVDSGHNFSHRVLNLDARIHLDEVPTPRIRIEQEFDCAGVAEARGLHQAHRRRAKLAANRRIEIRSRRDFDHFLMPALHRAIALPQMQHVAMIVAENLHFDVPRARQIFLDENGCVAERPERLALSFLKQRIECARLAHNAHAAPASAHRGFQHHGVAEFCRRASRFFRRSHRRFGTGQHRHINRSCQAPRRCLVAEHF